MRAVFSHSGEKETEAYILELLLHSSAPLSSTPAFASPQLHSDGIGATHFRWGYFDDKSVLEQRVGLLIDMETSKETGKGRVVGREGGQRMVHEQG